MSDVVLPYSFRAATVRGEIQAHARRRGRPRPINDSWVAACSIARELPLATLNIEDYDPPPAVDSPVRNTAATLREFVGRPLG